MSVGKTQVKLLAVDVGQARIGIAVSDPLGLTARPLMVLERRSRRTDFAVLADIVKREAITSVICGLPLMTDGSQGSQARTIVKWAERLAHALRTLLGHPVPIIFWDEQLTTFAARQIMADLEMDGADDAVAAAVLLQHYLDARRTGEEFDYGQIRLPPKNSDQA